MNGYNQWRKKGYKVIFENDTPAGKLFDVSLIIFILLSVFVVMIDTSAPIHEKYGILLYQLEWVFTIIFTIEYVCRLIVVKKSGEYAKSFFGVVDLLSILPSYLGLLFAGVHILLVIRIFRLLRVFRVLKLVNYVSEADHLWKALKASKQKIIVFLTTVLILNIIVGALMYLIEGPEHGFTSMLKGVYWSIVTMTTVGFGDIAPITPIGQTIAAFLMIMGFGIIAVPTGIFSLELVKNANNGSIEKSCSNCSCEDHDMDARYCKICGAKL